MLVTTVVNSTMQVKVLLHLMPDCFKWGQIEAFCVSRYRFFIKSNCWLMYMSRQRCLNKLIHYLKILFQTLLWANNWHINCVCFCWGIILALLDKHHSQLRRIRVEILQYQFVCHMDPVLGIMPLCGICFFHYCHVYWPFCVDKTAIQYLTKSKN